MVATGIGEPPGGVTVETNSVQPVAGVGQTVTGAFGPKGVEPNGLPKPEPGSSSSNIASEALGAPATGNKRLVTAVFKESVMVKAGTVLPTRTWSTSAEELEIAGKFGIPLAA